MRSTKILVVADQRTPWKIIPPDELRSRFQQIAIEKGLTLHRVVDKIAEHLDARANETLEGKRLGQTTAPDYRVQQRAMEQLAKFTGLLDSQKSSGDVSGIYVSITGPAADRLAGLLYGE